MVIFSVDCTCGGMCGNPIGLKEISENTGVHVVTGTGYYLARVHPPEVSCLTVDQLAEKFVKEITSGIGDTGRFMISRSHMQSCKQIDQYLEKV